MAARPEPQPTTIAGVPVLLSEPATSPSHWAVLLHAMHESKERAAASPTALLLARRGIGVLAPDLPMHGARRGRERYDPDRHRLRVAATMAAELPPLLDALDADPAIVFGSSLGGLCALAGAARSPRARIVVACSTRVGWGPLAAGGSAADRRRAAQFDPVAEAPSFAGRSLLLVLGEHDRWARPAAVLAELEPIRAAVLAGGGEVVTEVVPDAGHRLPATLAGRLVDWAAARVGASATPRRAFSPRSGSGTGRASSAGP